MICLEVKELKITEFVCLLDLLGGRGNKRWRDLVYVERP